MGCGSSKGFPDQIGQHAPYLTKAQSGEASALHGNLLHQESSEKSKVRQNNGHAEVRDPCSSNTQAHGTPGHSARSPSRRRRSKFKPKDTQEEVIRKLHDKIPMLLTVRDYTETNVVAELSFMGKLTLPKVTPEPEIRALYVTEMTHLGVVELFLRIWKQLFTRPDLFEKETLTSGKAVTLQWILILIWNGSDCSDTLRQSLVDMEIHLLLLRMVLMDAKMDPAGQNKDNPMWKFIVKGSLGVLHNMVHHCEIRECLRESRAVRSLQTFTQSSDVTIQCKTDIILVHLLDDTESADFRCIQFILKVLKANLNSPNHFSAEHGLTLEEILVGLNRMLAIDSYKEKLVDKDAVTLLNEVTQDDCSQGEQALAVRCLWLLSFSEKCRKVMKDHPGCLERLRDLSRLGNHGDVGQAALGALWKLTDQEAHQVKASPVHTDTKHILISYQRGSAILMEKVTKRLREVGYKVRMETEVKVSTLESMTEAVGQAAVVLVAMTHRYMESPRCRTEAEYALQLGKDFIPLRLQANYQPNGWLGSLVDNKLWIDFSRTDSFGSSLKRLVRELGSRGYSEQQTDVVIEKRHIPKNASTSNSDDKTGAATWDHKQVLEWLNKNGLGDQHGRFSEFDGRLLLEYRSMYQTAPEFFFHSLEAHLGLNLPQMLHFQKCLKLLT